MIMSAVYVGRALCATYTADMITRCLLRGPCPPESLDRVTPYRQESALLPIWRYTISPNPPALPEWRDMIMKRSAEPARPTTGRIAPTPADPAHPRGPRHLADPASLPRRSCADVPGFQAMWTKIRGI